MSIEPTTSDNELLSTVAGSSLTPEERQLLESFRRVFGDATLRSLSIFPLPENFLLSVVMPVYNEKETIHEIIQRVRDNPIPKEIIIVDDFSRDGTRDELVQYENDPYTKVIYHEKNQGKGGALKTGFAETSGDIVLIQDADLEYDPSEYARLIQPIIEGNADVVYGSRFIGNTVRVHMFWHRVANGILTLMSNLLTNLNLTDMETCYKVFRRELLEKFEIHQKRFGVEPELTAKFARLRCRIYETPISYYGRDYSEGKKIGVKDAIEAVWCIFRYWAFK